LNLEKDKLKERDWCKRNKEKIIKKQRKYLKELNIFADKHCKKCNKLLTHKSTSGYCIKHFKRGKSKTITKSQQSLKTLNDIK